MGINGAHDWEDRPEDDSLRADSLDEMPLHRDVPRLHEPTCVPCASCDKMIAEFAIRCHRCGAYVTVRPPRGVPAWMFFTALVLLGAAALAFVRSMN
ncbi:MAG TPA: hypothetical protein PK402_02710 [Tepidisphaeraceae bacterium]|nr:hypothetical protein [Tepidisphaeraceae bacterium]